MPSKDSRDWWTLEASRQENALAYQMDVMVLRLTFPRLADALGPV